MAVWENIPDCKRESIKNALYRFDRIQKRKTKIKNLCLLQEVGVKMAGNTDKKTM
jgi:hypothetical protein